MPYAVETDVPVDRSKSQIEALLRNHGAEGYHSGWQAPSSESPGWDLVEFLWQGKLIRFRIPRLDPRDRRVAYSKAGVARSPSARAAYLAQADRSRWRVLYLVIKAKLEAVEAGVSVFEEEFLAFIVAANGRTVGEVLLPRLEAARDGRLLLE